MVSTFFSKAALAAMLWGACGVSLAQELELAWFKNDTTCDGATVTVRSHCVPDEGMAVNHQCGSQELVIARAGAKPVTVDPQRYEGKSDENRIAVALRCVAAGKRSYLELTIANGGSCPTCERFGLIGMDGRWKRYGAAWKNVPTAERREIGRAEPQWRAVPWYAINNTDPDEAPAQ